MRNAEIADAFAELADLYELDGAVVHRVLAYRTAAATVRNTTVSVAELARAGRAEELPGIGRTLAEKIGSLLEDGRDPRHPAPPGALPARPDRGHPPAGLRRQARAQAPRRARDRLPRRPPPRGGDARLRSVPGFGPKAEANVLVALATHEDGGGRPRVLLARAREVGEELVEALRSEPSADRVELAGSARRMADTVKDLDVVASSSDPSALVAAFEALPLVEEVSRGGEAGARGVTHSGLGVDLRIVAPRNFGNLLQHLTGSGRHNEALRTDGRPPRLARERVRGHGPRGRLARVRDRGGGLRAARPALDPARAARGPRRARGGPRGPLPGPGRARATCAATSTATRSPRTAARRSRRWWRPRARAGYEYLAITDHSASRGFGNAVSVDELRRQVEHIRELDAATAGLRACSPGRRSTSLPDGSLDYDDEVLGRARLGRGQHPLVVPHGRGRDDRAHGARRSSTRWSTRSAIRPAA